MNRPSKDHALTAISQMAREKTLPTVGRQNPGTTAPCIQCGAVKMASAMRLRRGPEGMERRCRACAA